MHRNELRPKLAVSSCLLGEVVRYDGRDKRNDILIRELGRHFEFVSVCPETAIGLGVPRPPIQLYQVGTGIRARGVDDPKFDVTERLQACARSMAAQLAEVAGYITKQASPSCGMTAVRVVDETGTTRYDGTGLYIAAIMQQWPTLPVMEEDRLTDQRAVESFIERVFVHDRWQCMCKAGFSVETLRDFHARHEHIVLARDEAVYRQLGRLLAGVDAENLAAVAGEYYRLMMAALEYPQ
jgi:uncharacterized protein YbbK (DUF523 family)